MRDHAALEDVGDRRRACEADVDAGNKHALSGSADKTVKLFNVNDGAVLRTFKHHTRTVTSLALLPDGLRFVSGSDDQTARIAYHGLYHGLAP